MKIVKILFLLITILIFQNLMIYAQNRYVYPLNPSMSEWKSLSIEEKNKMLQIPDAGGIGD